jgi:serine/threonine protein phosphatase PrpC
MLPTDQFPVVEPGPRWHTASAQGPRGVNADAVGAFSEVFALADGVGDHEGAAHAARVAAAVAVRSPVEAGPVAAVLAAQRAVRELPGSGDCVLVVAMPMADGAGYRIAWVGDTRAYSTGGGTLRQLTNDHTLAQYFRDHGQPTAPHMEHMVTTSVRTANAHEVGTAETHADGLLLTSDGVHKTLTAATMLDILAQPEHAATALVETAIALGGSDNATALLVEPAASRADVTTTRLTAAA